MKLLRVLNKLSNRELTKFEQFLASPFFNKRSDIPRFFEVWKKHKDWRFPPEVYWKKVFADKVFSVSQWNLLVSRTFKLLEEFLTLNEMRDKEAEKKFFLVKAYRKLQNEKLFKEAINNTNKALEQQSFRNTSYLQAKHDLAFERYDYVISINRKEKTNLQEVSDHFDTYFLSTKLKQACNALSRVNIKQEEYRIGLLDFVVQYIEQNEACLKTPAIAIYYYCYLILIDENDEASFLNLKKAIQQYQHLFPGSEIRDIYTVAINFSIRKLNTGSKSAIEEAFELYKASLNQGFLLEDGILLESTYSNIINLASKLGYHNWAKTFIGDYQKHLKPTFQIPLYHFSLGKIYYEQNQLNNSLQELIQVETKASFLFLAARVLQLKIYYELEEVDLLESLIDSIRVYLQRSKDLAYRKEHYSNIISFTRQLLQLPVMSKKEKEAFRQRVSTTEIFAEKDWFLKQIGT